MPEVSEPDANETTENVEPGFGDDGLAPVESADPAPSLPSDAGEATSDDSSGVFGLSAQWLAALAALLAALAGAVWWFLRRKKNEAEPPQLLPAPALATNMRETQSEPAPVAAPMEPVSAAPQVAPARAPQMALQLGIVSASRSMMMFTVEYRLNIANRADQALRDLSVSSRLVCARQSANAPAPTDNLATETVERIGPQQSRTIGGTVQLPLRDISPLRQGSKPLFVPLIEVTIEGAGQTAKTHKFVVGLPSATSANRLHPIPLDTPPGGVHGLRANELKDIPAKQPA